nr:RNA-directed DNA polymerase, eukaryota, reverse transcriptase zinc-binding domain protein [Tanacetum cinerariifolium]
MGLPTCQHSYQRIPPRHDFLAVHSDAVGNSSGILCVWDPNSFCKNNVTLSDYFVIIRGCWRLTGHNFLLIAVYAPQDSRDKQSLWEYLQHEIGKWKGEVIIMGDFNERYISDHRPILLRENHYDYGPTPFRFFHHRLEMDGFCKLVDDTWKVVDLIIDSGHGTEKEISTRADIINKIQRCDKLDSMEMAQKAKVKWAVEGDENSGSIIINGSPTEEFQFGKGLKQGDPLSSFLFILIMESLHLSFQRVVDAGMFHGIKLDGSMNLSHMFYADDAVFVGQWSENNICTLVHVLECFHRVSELKINMSKSKILGVHMNNVKVSRAVNKLGCLVLKTPFLYLGSFVGGAIHQLQGWNDIVDRVRRRLSKWKMKMFSIGGILTLVKSELDTSLWARVIKAIHGGDGNIGAGTRSGTKSCWMNIVNEINVLSKKDINLMNFLRIKLGNGESTLFWEDVWCEGGKLKDRFPRAYALESCKTITVESKLVQPNLTYSFRRTPRGGEFSVASVRNLIDVKIFPEGEHKTRWIRYVPIKVNTHAWKVMSNSLPTRFNILRCGIDIDSITCVNCDMGVETTSHLFFTCDMAQQVARLITRWWDVPDLEIDSYGSWKIWMVNLRMPSKNKKMLEGVFYVMWWLLWAFRNKKIFEDKAPSKAMFFDDVICKSFIGVVLGVKPRLVGTIGLRTLLSFHCNC